MLSPEILEAVERLMGEYGFGATQGVIEAHWQELSSSAARELLAYQITHYEPHEAQHRVITARLKALEGCIAEGCEAAFSGYEDAARAIIDMVNAETWDEVRAVVEGEQHHLLPWVADVAFADLVTQLATDQDRSHVLGGWNLVQACRDRGIEEAFKAQQRPTRGVILGPEAAASLAQAASDEEVMERLEGLPELEPALGRRREGQVQAAQWDGFDDYLAAMQALAAPGLLASRIETCRTALADIDGAALPLMWAMVALDLADALFQHAGQRPAPDMAEPIALYREVLTILTAAGEPDQFGHAWHFLGTAYLLDAGGDRAENLEAAIAAYENALGVRRRRAEPLAWATTTSNLGEALRHRVRGERAANLERAVHLLAQAVEVLEGVDQDALLASARVSLAAALMDRLSGAREENLERAAGHLEAVIERLAPGSQPELWGRACADLGGLYWTRAHAGLGDSAASLERARVALKMALDRVGAQVSPAVRALLHMGLGLVLSDQLAAGVTAVDEAIDHLQAAVAAFEEEGPVAASQMGLAYHNLGVLFRDRAGGDRQVNRAAAEQMFQRALATFARDDYPVERRDTLQSLAALYFEDERWPEAQRCFAEGIAISEESLGGSYTEAGRVAEVTEGRNLFSRGAYCLLQLGRLPEALALLERGKARMLNEALAWRDIDVATVPDERQQALRWARDQIVSLRAESRRPGASADPQRAVHLAGRLRDAVRTLANLRAAAGPEAPTDLEFADIRAAIPAGGALVAPVVTSKGSVAFVVPAGAGAVAQEHVLRLDALLPSLLGELMAGRQGLGGWLNAYLRHAHGQLSFSALLAALDSLLAQLGQVLMEPIHRRLAALGLAKGAPVLIMPSSWLSLFPLHTAGWVDNGGGHLFLDDFTVSYAPSIRTLLACRRRVEDPQRRERRLLAVANPTGDLMFAEAECAALLELFASWAGSTKAATRLPRSAADRSRVLRELSRANYGHFSCHGTFDWSDPSRSGLRLAAGDWLSLPEVLSPAVDLGRSRLVTLSACESGLAEFRDMPDEFLGLPGAFMEAGAPAVVSSLWAVDDYSTSLLMGEFYRRHLWEGQGIAQALRGAQLWLRDLGREEVLDLVEPVRERAEHEDSVLLQAVDTLYWGLLQGGAEYEHPFAHPYYWGAFTASGAV